MDILIFKTNIGSDSDFSSVKDSLISSYKLNDCTIDLEDIDKVLRVIGNGINTEDVINKVGTLGFLCEELSD
jgi:hypothetical protein